MSLCIKMLINFIIWRLTLNIQFFIIVIDIDSINKLSIHHNFRCSIIVIFYYYIIAGPTSRKTVIKLLDGG